VSHARDVAASIPETFLGLAWGAAWIFPKALAQDRVLGLAYPEISVGWIGDNHAERDAVGRILREGNEERGLEAGSVVIVK
jgi:hypothetical protein